MPKKTTKNGAATMCQASMDGCQGWLTTAKGSVGVTRYFMQK